MTPLEIKAAVVALREEIGPQCSVSFDIKSGRYDSEDDPAINFYCWPIGSGSDKPFINGRADTWHDALDAVRREWAEISADVAKDVTRNMALAIIRITADIGGCTDAALRADEFTEEDIEVYGAEACTMADEMASNGPFKITALAGANAA